MTKKIDTKALLEQARNAKNQPKTKMMQKKLGRDKKDPKFGKVNFNG